MLGAHVGATIHEIGHALGLSHEQSRPDRDTFVTIRTQWIQSNAAHNFDICTNTGWLCKNFGPCKSQSDMIRVTREECMTLSLLASDDYGSIMHYGEFDFTTNPNERTIVPIASQFTAYETVSTVQAARPLSAIYRSQYRCLAWFHSDLGNNNNWSKQWFVVLRPLYNQQ